MRITSFLATVASAALLAACSDSPTSVTDTLQSEFDGIDPVVAVFTATDGLPDGPFAGPGLLPFMGTFTLPPGLAILRPANFGPRPDIGAPLPDSLKLTAAQKTQIQALVAAFQTANQADLDAMKTAHLNARAARRAGKSRDEVRAILDAAKPAAERVRTAGQALHAAIQNVLTPAQRTWIAAHRPTLSFRMPQ